MKAAEKTTHNALVRYNYRPKKERNASVSGFDAFHRQTPKQRTYHHGELTGETVLLHFRTLRLDRTFDTSNEGHRDHAVAGPHDECNGRTSEVFFQMNSAVSVENDSEKDQLYRHEVRKQLGIQSKFNGKIRHTHIHTYQREDVGKDNCGVNTIFVLVKEFIVVSKEPPGSVFAALLAIVVVVVAATVFVLLIRKETPKSEI